MSTVEDIQKKFIEAVETITKMQNSQMTHLQIVKGKVVALDPIACYVKFSYNNHEYFGYSAISNFKIGEVILVLFDGSEDNNVVLCSVTSTVSGGKSISDLTMQYYLSNSNVKTDIPESDPGWVTTEPTPTTDKPYIWTRVIYVYSDGEVKNGEKALLNGVEVLADQIQKNKQLIIVLDNENQSISTDNNGENGDYSNAKTSIKVYYGSEDVTSTSDISFVLTNVIGSYNSTSYIYTVINLTTDSGNVAITATYTPANLPTLTTTKIFSLSKARAGTNGTSGTSGKVANILATAQVFKSMDGGVTFTPDLITLTPSLQSVAFSKWQYSVDGGLTWLDAVTGAHGITISDNILTLSENSDLYTDTITSVVIKLTTDDSTVYDTETIVRLLDGAQGIQGPKGADGKSSYTHIAYANSADGTSAFSTSDSNRAYIGMYVDQTATDSTDPTKYKWTLIKGADGAQGTPGKAGSDGKTPYFHTAYSWSADGTDRFTTVYPAENLYLNSKAIKDGRGTNGAVSVTVEPFDDTTNMWHFVLGKDNGDKVGIFLFKYGEGKIPDNSDWSYSADVKGTGKVTWFGIEDGNHKPIVGTVGSEWSRISQTGHFDTGVKTIVMYFDTTNSPLDVYIKLPKLEIGTPTPWTPSPLDDPEGAYPQFIGTYTDYIADDSTDQSKYTWAKIRGKDGKAGKSIKTFSTEYYLSSSSVEQKDGEWTNVFPTKTPTTYIWYRNLITYTDNSTAISDPVLDDSANNFYTITETNTTNISQLSDRITNEVQSITTVTTQLSDKQTATDTKVSKLQQDTTNSLTDLKTAQDNTAKDLSNYKNTVTTTYYTKSEIDQQADSVNVKIQKAVEEAQTKTLTTLTETTVDARGFSVNTENADTHTTIDGTGMMVRDKDEKNVIQVTVTGVDVKNLKVSEGISMASHSTQEFDDYEFDEKTMADETTKTQGSANFWVGDVI